MKMLRFFTKGPVLVMMALLLVSPLAGQDSPDTGENPTTDSGFGFESDSSLGSMDVKISGELNYKLQQFLSDWENWENNATLSTTEGILEFSSSSSDIEALIRLKLSQSILSENPGKILDTARLSISIGQLDLEGGLLKITWGKADSLGVLDVINPLDLTDLSITDKQSQKIAQPLLHAILPLGDKARLEAVYLPFFQPNQLAFTGLWVTDQIQGIRDSGYQSLYTSYLNSYTASLWASVYAQVYASALPVTPSPAQIEATNNTAIAAANATVSAQSANLQTQAQSEAQAQLNQIINAPDTQTLEYSQAGARLTATWGPVDFGFQYFYGYLPMPAADTDPASITANGNKVDLKYNRYHQAGIDFASVLFGFNTRAEIAANLTDDWDGNESLVYNPTIAWGFGFDREIFAGITLNVQAREKIILSHDSISDPYDVEYGSDMTKTEIAALASQKLFKDKLIWELAGLWGVEDNGLVISPCLSMSFGEAVIKFSGKIFCGQEDSELGQFNDQTHAQMELEYKF